MSIEQNKENEYSNSKKQWDMNDPQTRHINDYYFLQGEYFTSLLAHYKDKNPHEVRKHAWEGAIKLMDSVFIAEALQMLRPKNILEIGSFIGFSTRWMLDKTETWSAHVTAVDPNIPHRIFENPRSHLLTFCRKHKQRLKTIEAYLSRGYRWAPKVPVITQPFGQFDFAFIDGDHSFLSTLRNVALVARMMPQGGLIIVHDAISWPAVAAAIEILANASPEIDYRIIGSNVRKSQIRLKPLSSEVAAKIWPRAPLTLSIRKWNHYRIARRRYQTPSVYLACDGLGIIKVRHGQKLDEINLASLLPRRKEMIAQKDKIIQQRCLPNDDLASFLSAQEFQNDS